MNSHVSKHMITMHVCIILKLLFALLFIQHIRHTYSKEQPLFQSLEMKAIKAKDTECFVGVTARLYYHNTLEMDPCYQWFFTRNTNYREIWFCSNPNNTIATKFSHVTTAVLSWHVRAFVAIKSIWTVQRQNVISVKYELWMETTNSGIIGWLLSRREDLIPIAYTVSD